MFDGSTPAPEPAPFAVGYGNGYGYESAPTPAASTSGAATAAAATAPASPRWGEGAATMAMPAIDPDATQAVAVPVVAPVVVAGSAPAPYDARPAGAAHPRRRFGRGLVLGGLALLVAGGGMGAVALASGAEVHPAAATVSASSHPAGDAATALGDQIGRGVDPTAGTGDPMVPVPVSIVESPPPTAVTPTVPTPPPTAPPTTTPPTTTPTTTTPPTTTPPTTTPPTTAPTGPAFATLTAPSTAACPNPGSDVTVSFTWSAPGATKVTLSIDGPGIYQTYPGSSGSETVNFPCSSSHTYLFSAFGANNVVTTRSFTVSPS